MLPVAGSLLVLGCADGRPEEEEAKAWFENHYRGAKVSDVRITEDETIARSFRFEYRSAAGRGGRLEVQFMQDSSGTWRPRPAAPAALP